MRTVLLAIVIAVLPAESALAGPSGGQKPDKSAPSGKLLPLKRAGASDSCAAFGPDFAKVEGTGTCVKIGGGVSVGSLGSRR